MCKETGPKINIGGGWGVPLKVLSLQLSVVSKKARGFGWWSWVDCAPGEGNYMQTGFRACGMLFSAANLPSGAKALTYSRALTLFEYPRSFSAACEYVPRRLLTLRLMATGVCAG